MKCIIISFIIAFPALVFSQQKKDDAILLHGVAFKSALKIIAQQGYPLHNYDADLGFATTDFKNVKLNLKVKFALTELNDSTIQLTGTSSVEMDGAVTGTIRFAGMKGSPIRNAFNEMNRIAGLITSEKTYKKL